MSISFTFGFLDSKPDHPDDQAEGFSQQGSKLETTHDNSLSSDVRDSPATSERRKPFTFRQMIDVERALTELASKDLQVEYVSFPESSIEPLLQIQLTQDAFRHDNEVGNATQLPSNMDLIPGAYEGGATVWECSKDLLLYMISNKVELLQRKHVLELGCGHALPSSWWLRERMMLSIPKTVGEFQDEADFSIMCSDFNDFVVDNIVLSNLSVNTQRSPSEVAQHIVVGAGDWMDMSRQLLDQPMPRDMNCLKPVQRIPIDGKFDLILAAETTYTENAARETAELMRRHLKLDTGIGLVATKRYYFGVGGGSHAFCKYAMETPVSGLSSSMTPDAGLVVETLKVYDNGAGNIRELLKVQCISRPADVEVK